MNTKVDAKVPVPKRPGTVLNWSSGRCTNLSFAWHGKQTQHGTLDLSQGVYQAAGQESDFRFRKQKLITMPEAIWNKVVKYRHKMKLVEWYDREANECWQVPFADAFEHGVVYEAGIGRRYGVPEEFFSRLTGENVASIVQKPIMYPPITLPPQIVEMKLF